MSRHYAIERDEEGRAARMVWMGDSAPEISAATLTCRFCGGSLPTAPHPGSRRVFCSPEHRRAHYERQHPRIGTQAALDFAPALAARSSLLARKPSPAVRAKLKPAALNILVRLQEGPATWVELQRIGGRRYSARIEEIRAAGHRVVGPEPSRKHGISETTTAGADGLDVYELRVS